MNIDGRNYKTLLIVGAGASRGALAGTKSPRVSSPLNSDFFRILSNYSKSNLGSSSRSAFLRLDNFLRNEIDSPSSSSPPMEDVFNVLFLSKDLPNIFHRGRGRRRQPGYRPEVRDFLVLLVRLFYYVQNNCRHRNGIDHYAKIVSALSSDDTIMTLNYDTLIDNALVTAGWNPRTGYGFTPRVICRIRRPIKTPPHLRRVLLLKPHGSLNWFAKGTFSTLDKSLRTRTVSKIVITSVPRLYENPQKGLVRFFIPPLYVKFFTNKFWAKLWTRTYESARNADRIVIIGLSLLPSDYHLRAILRKANSDKRKKYKEIVLVNPDVKTQKRFKSFFRGQSETGVTVYQSFSALCKALP